MTGRTEAQVLLVEDEYLVAMLMQDQLEALGFKNVKHASSVEEALVVIRDKTPDLCFLDVSLSGQSSLGIAVKLKADGVPFAFMTGFRETALPEEWREQPLLGKPFSETALAEMVARLEALR